MAEIPKLIVEWLDDDEGLARLVEDFEWHGVRVPAGFVTDGCSVPPIGRVTIPKWGAGAKAGVIHDKLYVSHEKTKDESDDLFRALLLELGVEEAEAWMMHTAVKYGGQGAWERRSAFGLDKRPELTQSNIELVEAMG